MNDTVYRTSFRWAIRLATLPALAPLLGFGLRVLGRHHRLFTHLRALGFDGVIDGGANVGEFAHLVRRALPQADLLCIEPHPACAAELRRAGFRTVEAALWREAGRLALRQPESATTSCTVQTAASEAHGSWEVAAVRLDDLPIRGQRLLVKLDLQGAELAALEGMGALWDRTAALHLEMTVGGRAREALERVLRERGFFDYATTNELLVKERVVEADKLWLKEGLT